MNATSLAIECGSVALEISFSSSKATAAASAAAIMYILANVAS